MGLLQLYDQFFESHSNPTPRPSNIFWVPVQEIQQVPKILSVERANPDEHEITNFEIEEISSEHYKREDRLPVKRLELQPTNELLISKSKLRPAVVISTAQISNLESIEDPVHRRIAAKSFNSPLYILAPFYGVSTLREPGTFGPEFVDRIRRLQYTNLFCVTNFKNEEPQVPSSIIRLDHLFVSHLKRGSRCTKIKLRDEPFEILQMQLSIALGCSTEETIEEFSDIQELLN